MLHAQLPRRIGLVAAAKFDTVVARVLQRRESGAGGAVVKNVKGHPLRVSRVEHELEKDGDFNRNG